MAFLSTKYSQIKEYDVPLFAQPSSCEEMFSVKSIDDSGIFVLNNNKYSKSFVLSDVNFAGVTNTEQEDIIYNFSLVLNALPCRFSYTVANEYINGETFNDRIFYKKRGDDLDSLRDSFNDLINEKVSEARHGLYQKIYFTLTVDVDSIEEARVMFNSLEASLSKALIQIGINGMAGSEVEALGIDQRMQLWYNFTHAGIKTNFKFDYNLLFDKKKDWLNVVSPQSVEFHNDYFIMNGNKFGRVLYISKHAFSLSSDFVADLSNISCSSYISVNSEILELSVFKQELKRKDASVGLKIEGEKENKRKKNDFLSDASDKLLAEKEKLNTLTRLIEKNDDRYFNTTVLMMFFADSYEELTDLTKKIYAIANIKGAKLEPCFSKQREGINSCFMFGIQEFKRCANLSSLCEAMYMPFKTQELNESNGGFYGLNRLSQNAILANRKNMSSWHGVILGQTGSGKSVLSKLEILSLLCLYPEQYIIIIDPLNEYKKLGLIDGVNATVISFDTKKDIYINPLDVNFENVDYSGLQEIIADKADFIFTLFSSCMHKSLSAAEQGVLDKVIRDIYSKNYASRCQLNGVDVERDSEFEVPERMKQEKEVLSVKNIVSPEDQERQLSPVLQDIYQGLLDMVDNDVAQSLAGHLGIFVEGSLNLFNNRTNVDLSSKFIIFDVSEIKENISTTCMLVMLEIVRNKIRHNFQSNEWTNVFIDEFHELLKESAVTDYVIKLWKEVRHWKGCMTGITQNMTDLLNNSPDAARLAAILSNSEYFAMLRQSTIDRRMLADFLPSISPAMFNYVEGAPSGTGLLKMGAVTVPFDIRMKKTCSIYKYIHTDSSGTANAV